jgi:hypothetical protein
VIRLERERLQKDDEKENARCLGGMKPKRSDIFRLEYITKLCNVRKVLTQGRFKLYGVDM